MPREENTALYQSKSCTRCLLLLLLAFGVVFGCKSSAGGSLAPGQKPPAFSLRALNGDEKVQLQDFEGELILLTFWASWCAPCLTEMKEFNKIHDAFGQRGLRIVAIGSDDTEAALSKAAKQLKVEFTLLFDKEGLTKTRYSVSGFPETFIVKPDGRLALFPDPVSGPTLVVKGERPWSSSQYKSALEKYLPAVKR